MTPRLGWIVFGILAVAWLDLWLAPAPKVTFRVIQGGRR